MDKFPTVKVLASASLDELMLIWQGLGYYTRARNLHETAQYIVKEKNSRFPDNYEEILSLKGIGPYSAAAISSFAFNLPHAVLDGNVIRVMSRLFDLETDSDSSEGRKTFQNLAQELLDFNNPGPYNQAIMDFGATVCTPQTPKCYECPLSSKCKSFLNGTTGLRPVRRKQVKIRERNLSYYLIQAEDKIAIRKRDKNDIWNGLYELALVEPKREHDPGSNSVRKIISNLKTIELKVQNRITHLLSHQRLFIEFIEVKIPKMINIPGYQWVGTAELEEYPFPNPIYVYLNRRRLHRLN